MCGVEHRVTSSYHPQTNGQCERMNFVIIEMVRTHCGEHKLSWPQWMNHFEDYRLNEIDANTDELMFKRSFKLKNLIDNKIEVARSNIKKSQISQKLNKDKSHRMTEINLKKGTKVMVPTVGIKDKLHPKFTGLYTIMEQKTGGK